MCLCIIIMFLCGFFALIGHLPQDKMALSKACTVIGNIPNHTILQPSHLYSPILCDDAHNEGGGV